MLKVIATPANSESSLLTVVDRWIILAAAIQQIPNLKRMSAISHGTAALKDAVYDFVKL